MRTTTTTLVRTRGELARGLARLRRGGGSVALVPTMGALHDGHRALIARARELAEHVVVTVFVNPLQFGPGEDLETYPRSLEDDLEMCRREGVALVWAPTADVVYPQPPRVTVSAGALGERLCGRSRPGHFDGVLTVVAKLVHLTTPDVAVFGEKDAQQLALIRRMVSDLDLPVHVVGVPTVREPDGVARSSRHAYLDRAGRAAATALCRALAAAAAARPDGPAAVLAAAAQVLAADPPLRVDYLALVHPTTLEDLPAGHTGPALLAVAAYVGDTRLIDNVTVDFAG